MYRQVKGPSGLLIEGSSVAIDIGNDDAGGPIEDGSCRPALPL
jgi:hypothetical protein